MSEESEATFIVRLRLEPAGADPDLGWTSPTIRDDGTATPFVGRWPPETIGVLLLFAPTRSRIERVDVAPDAVGRVRNDETPDGDLRLHLQWEAGDGIDAIDVALTVRGEPVEPFVTQWLAPGRALTTITADEVRYNFHEHFAGIDPRHAFLFELERQSLPRYFRLNRELGPVEREVRREIIEDLLAGPLRSHARARFRNSSTALRSSRPTLSYVSTIFWDATDALFPGGRPGKPAAERRALEDALLDFAAGATRERLTKQAYEQYVGPLDPGVVVRPRWISEPDSYYIFFYAMFGILARDAGIDVARWESVLPCLLRMQKYYVERCYPRRGRVVWYRQPKDALEACVRQSIDDTYQAMCFDRNTIDAEFRQNIRALASSF